MFFGTTDSHLDSNHVSVRKNWTYMPSATWSYGTLVDKMLVDFKTFQILYRLNDLDFYFV